MNDTNRLISLIIPAYREARNIEPLYLSLLPVIKELSGDYTFEILYINDGSTDATWYEIEALSSVDPRVKGINLSRNFGKELAITAGLAHARWDAIITLDADGQHPVEKIPEFITKWRDGYDVVYNKRPEIHGAPIWKKLNSWLFYKIFNSISDFKLEPNTTDYRLLDRKVVDAYLQFGERNRIYRGLIDWLGFSKYALVFEAKKRHHGEASYTHKMLVRLALHSMTSFSFFPLKLVGYLGIIMTLFSTLLFIFVIVDKFTIDRFNFSNIAAILLVNMILIGIVLIALWLIALYIANIHSEVIGRPLYVVKDKKNID